MAEPGSRAGRTRDANRARAAMLDAAEAVFAQHGFAGARFEAIAHASGYNSALLSRYFGDKLTLYVEVLQRADLEMSALLAQAFAPLLSDGTITADAHRFRDVLRTTFGAVFDYMVDHPHLRQMFNWEQAAGAQTVAQLASHFAPDDLARFETHFSQASAVGLVRPGVDVAVLVGLVAQICWSVPAALPLYQLLLSQGGSSSAAPLAHLREQVISMLIAWATPDPRDAHPEESR